MQIGHGDQVSRCMRVNISTFCRWAPMFMLLLGCGEHLRVRRRQHSFHAKILQQPVVPSKACDGASSRRPLC